MGDNSSKKLRTVALLARDAGVHVLRESLLLNPFIDLCAVAVPRLFPRIEDPYRSKGDRPEFASFVDICQTHHIPLIEADNRSVAGELSFTDAIGNIDMICSVSWRFILSPQALSIPSLGCINLHRGELPGYAGAEPVRRMIEDGRKEAVITAHLMTEEVDAGPVLGTVRYPFRRIDREDSVKAAERIKREILPLYAPLMDLAIACLMSSNSKIKRNKRY